MASIFSGTEPPAWLQAIARPIDTQLTGQVLGTGLGALTRMLTERNPVTDAQGKPVLDDSGKPKTEAPSFGQALGETRMSQQYGPLWKLKTQEAETSVWNNVAQLEATHQKLKMQADESKGRTADLPKLNQYMQDLKSDLSAVPPVMESIWGQQQVETLSRAAQMKDLANQRLTIQQQNSKAEAESRAKVAEFDSVIARDPLLESSIATLDGKGYTTDGYGRKIPTLQARQLVNQWLLDRGEQPLGTSVQEKTATIRTEGQLKAGAQRIEGAMALEDKRQADRKELEKVKQEYRIDLEKLKLSDRDEKGKVVTEDEYVNRHLNTLFNAMYKDSEKPDAKKSLDDAEHALRARYRIAHKYGVSPKPSAAAQPAPNTVTAPAQPAPATGGKVLRYNPATDQLE